jgi:carbonic anhydrase
MPMKFMDGTSMRTRTYEILMLTRNRDVTRLHRMNIEYLSKANNPANEQNQDRILEETYVLAETDWLRNQPNVKKAMNERGLQIHAFVYDKRENRCVRLIEAEGVNGAK